MCKGRLSVYVLLLFSMAADLPAQERRLIVVNPSEKELVKEANRLRTCPERLKNAREALREALEMAPEIAKDTPVRLGSQLLRLESKQAPQLMSRLYEKLLDEAGQTTDPRQQASLHASAMDLISALKKQNPDLAAKLESRWPEGAQGLAATPEVAEASIQREIYQRMRANPEEALLQLPLAEAGGTDFSLRARFLLQFWADGKTEEARRLLNETLALPYSAGLREPLAFGRFIGSALGVFPDSKERLLFAFSNWYQTQVEAGGPEDDFRLPSGETLRVSKADHALLSQLAYNNLRLHPEFAEQVAMLSPTLKSRIHSAGSLSGLFRWNTDSRVQLRRSITEASGLEMEALIMSAASLRDLTAVVSEVCASNDLEKKERLFRALIRRIEAEPDPRQAASEIMNFGVHCTFCLGEFPDDWFQAGKNIVRQLNEAEQQDQPEGTPVPDRQRLQRSPAALEGFLYANRARTEFAAVMDEVRAIKEKPRAFAILMRIVESLGSS